MGLRALRLCSPALCSEIWASFGILYYVRCAAFTPMNPGRHRASESKPHLTMM